VSQQLIPVDEPATNSYPIETKTDGFGLKICVTFK
jgi:hypothetical protein